MLKAESAYKRSKKATHYTQFCKLLEKRILKGLHRDVKNLSTEGSTSLTFTLRSMSRAIKFDLSDNMLHLDSLFIQAQYAAPENFDFNDYIQQIIIPKLEDLGYSVTHEGYKYTLSWDEKEVSKRALKEEKEYDDLYTFDP